MKVEKITETGISDALQKIERRTYLTELNAFGFNVRLSPNGRAEYVHRAKVNGNTKDFKIGSCFELTTAKARKINLEIRSTLQQQRKIGRRTIEQAARDSILNYSTKYGVELPDHFSIESAYELFNAEHPRKVIRAYSRFLGYISGDIQINSISSQVIQDYYSNRVKTSVAVANKEIGYLKHLFNLEIQQNHLTYNPTRPIKLRKLQRRSRAIPSEHLSDFYSLLNDWLHEKPNTYSNQSAVLAIKFAIETGLRTNELFSLSFTDNGANNFIDCQNSVIHLRNWKTNSSSNVRYVPVSQQAMRLILEYRAQHKSNNVFPNNTSQKNIHISKCREAFNYARDHSSIPRHLKNVLTLYSTRHTAANQMLNVHKLSRAVVSEILGHTNPTTLLIYEGALLQRFIDYAWVLSKRD